jgi:hypothetical protein
MGECEAVTHAARDRNPLDTPNIVLVARTIRQTAATLTHAGLNPAQHSKLRFGALNC